MRGGPAVLVAEALDRDRRVDVFTSARRTADKSAAVTSTWGQHFGELRRIVIGLEVERQSSLGTRVAIWQEPQSERETARSCLPTQLPQRLRPLYDLAV